MNIDDMPDPPPDQSRHPAYIDIAPRAGRRRRSERSVLALALALAMVGMTLCCLAGYVLAR